MFLILSLCRHWQWPSESGPTACQPLSQHAQEHGQGYAYQQASVLVEGGVLCGRGSVFVEGSGVQGWGQFQKELELLNFFQFNSAIGIGIERI